jgi:AbrB family looped-hinge helix DNA binding protein
MTLDSSPPTAHPEPVEGLSFLFRHLKKEVRSFDRLRMSGDGFQSMNFGIIDISSKNATLSDNLFHESGFMRVELKIVSNGRIVLPIEVRKTLNLEDGDKLWLALKDTSRRGYCA